MKTLSTTEVTFMAWLGLIGASAAVTEVHAEDAFDGHRLFFTEAQRTQATGSGSDNSSESLPVALVQGPANAGATEGKNQDASKGEGASAGSVDPLDTRQPRLATSRLEGSANSYQVYFTGLVTGAREFRILVNGLPCEPTFAEHRGKSDQPVSIECHGVRNEALRLTVSIVTGKLVVTEQGGRVHHLLPGEAM